MAPNSCLFNQLIFLCNNLRRPLDARSNHGQNRNLVRRKFDLWYVESR